MSPSAFETLLPLAQRGMVLDLASMRAALAFYDNPHEAIATAHVAGTNGKGSVSAMVHAALRAAGVSAGLYTSPHLHRFTERFVLDDSSADPALADVFARDIMARIAAGALPPLTFFEGATLLAWRLFAHARLSCVVLEVGLGGRLDATNLCAPAVTAITRIAFDHQAILGPTLALIAAEKAGILKSGVPCVLGDSLRAGEARDAIENTAHAVGAPLREAPEITVCDVDSRGRAEVEFLWKALPERARLGLPGRHQAGNAAVALGVLDALSTRFSIDAEALKTGLSRVSWPARLERLDGVLIDGAHNPDGVRALCDALPEVCGAERVGALVFGASSDKPWSSMLDEIIAHTGLSASRRFFGAAPLPRAVAPDEIARAHAGVVCASPAEALDRARDAVRDGELVLACGSLYFVARVRAALLKIDEDPPIAM